MPEDIHWFVIVLNAVGGLVIFLYGVSHMADGLKEVGSAKMKRLVGKTTNNVFAGILTGIIVTALLESSSATIIMVIAMVSSGVLSDRQSYGIILGSNIGTTIGSQIFAFNVGEYSTIPLGIGFILFVISKNEKLKEIGRIILGIGLIFFGLSYIGHAVEPLKELSSFTRLMTEIENPFRGALVGTIVTFVIQSSSATVGIVLSFANQNLITLPAAVAIMLGAEIGTCFDTLLASIGRSREAIRAGLFHLLFNITTVIIGIIFITSLVKLVGTVSGEASLARQIANAHLIFNIIGALLFAGLIPIMAKLLYKIVPDKEIRKKG